ncbi:S1 RNA-binding domain-containing protein [Chondromyces apiculatus]|uniref:SSU ribosomal protein S1p n=1 Tax=Chondromyces apiculatus DSM 436 TaxID=1192034 RepID=A0A017TAL0_9BACT|nr:S1 RNA-binding domain-containing protein [Chondromyces apiculatus]EYF05865.1 SSU ribosomal protein S1p [Chondromyces apiculatus DSM 436]
MNSDENNTTPAQTSQEQVDQSPPASPSNSGSVEASAPPQAAEGAAPAEAATDAPKATGAAGAAGGARDSEQWADDQPGDDIGNRVRGSSVPDDIGNRRPGERAPAAAGEADAAGKKKRRRRRKGPGEGAQAGGGEAQQAGDAEDGESSQESGDGGDGDGGDGGEGSEAQGGGEKQKRRPGKGQPPQLRERPAFSIGEEVFGRVSRVTEHAVWIDIAGKATGLFDRRELMDDEPPAEGDQFIATVASTGMRGGMLVLSRSTASLDETRTRIEAASSSGDLVSGFVTGVVKGGLEVDLGGLRAFAPASHVDLHHGADLNYLVGQRLDFTVTQYAKKGRDIVVSRRHVLEEENRKARVAALSSIEPGSVHKGIVRKVVAWGVFVALPDAGNVEGLVHLTEASHDRGAKLTEIFRPGSEIEVKILRIDEKGKLWLSRKATTVDPWEAAKEKYAVGSRHKGRVARLQPFGAFIELESGIDGLIHTADLSMKPIQHPGEVVKVGDEIEVTVSNCDPAGRRIGLHPALAEGDASEPRQRVQQGRSVKVAVMQATEAGLIVRVLGVTGRAARGFIPAGHTGTQRGTDLRKEFPVDMQFDAKVIEVDPRRGEAKLSIRALKEDTERQAYQQYRAGVAREAKFGTFADLMKQKNS